MQEPRARAVHRSALVLQDRLVRSGTPEVALVDGARVAIVLRRHLLTVIDELGLAVDRARRLIEPPQRIVGQRGSAGGGGADQPVLGVVAVGVGSVGGQVAIAVVGERRRSGGQILVEPVGGVVPVDGGRAREAVVVVVLNRRECQYP